MKVAKIAVLACALLMPACAQAYVNKGMQGAPDADAKITATVVGENKLTQISIKAEHLAPPERLLAGTNVYVVWARQDANGDWYRIGKLDYDKASRKGAVDVATVPLTGFELAISAEKVDMPKSPSTTSIFTQKNSH